MRANDGEISGSVESITFVNPHGSLAVSVKNQDGTATVVNISAGNPND